MNVLRKLIVASYYFIFGIFLLGAIFGGPGAMLGKDGLSSSTIVFMLVLYFILSVLGLASTASIKTKKWARVVLIIFNSLFSLFFVYCAVMVFKDVSNLLFKDIGATIYSGVLLTLILIPQIFTFGIVKLFKENTVTT